MTGPRACLSSCANVSAAIAGHKAQIVHLTPGSSVSADFAQRHRLFSLYDDLPLLLDHEGWYSVTPERIAIQIAERMRCGSESFLVGANACVPRTGLIRVSVGI